MRIVHKSAVRLFLSNALTAIYWHFSVVFTMLVLAVSLFLVITNAWDMVNAMATVFMR